MPMYLPQGQQEVWFVSTLTSPAAPTKAEIEHESSIAFGRFSEQVNMPSATINRVGATPMGAKNPSSLGGLPTINDSVATVFMGDTPTDEFVELFHALRDKEKESGYLVFAPRGRIGIEDDADGEVEASHLASVFPARIELVALINGGAQDPAKFTVEFSHSGRWYPAVTVAAS